MSASSLVTWERCRRDWFLTRRLGIRVATHPEMLLGHIVEDAATGIWMERPHPTEGMLEADSLGHPAMLENEWRLIRLIRLPFGYEH